MHTNGLTNPPTLVFNTTFCTQHMNQSYIQYRDIPYTTTTTYVSSFKTYYTSRGSKKD